MRGITDFWKRSAALATVLKQKIGADIFATARLKITLLYLLMGCIILFVSWYVVYVHIISIIQSIIALIQQALVEGAMVDQNITTNLIMQTVAAEVERMNVGLALWVIFSIVVSAYLLAGITLRPIRQAMEKQKRFIANVSHELRTPLSVMKTNSEVVLLESGELGQDEFVTAIKSNLEEVDRMSKITQFLLDFSAPDSGRTSINFAHVNIAEVVEKAVDVMQGIAAEKDIKITVVRETSAGVWGNATALEEMIVNLLKNAVTYTPARGSVIVTIARRGYTSIVISVRDTGIGIPNKDLANVFDPFYRAKNSTPGSGQGKVKNTGLGLAIVKELTVLHRGTISIRSTLGEGTIVSLRLPMFAPKFGFGRFL